MVNVGSVSNPVSDDLRASYVILGATKAGYQLEHRRVEYDYAAVVEAIEHSRHPSSDFLLHFYAAR